MPTQGMLKHHLPLGSRIGQWTLIRPPQRRGGHGYYGLCQCVCGCIREVAWTRLCRGRAYSCGCQSHLPDDIRFEQRVTVIESGCYLWTGSLTPSGYGRYCVGGTWMLAHRYAYQRKHGSIPANHELHHTCETPACVNPEHLKAVTRREHSVELTPRSLASINAAKTHCSHGHELTPENTYVWSKKPSQRSCRECRRLCSLKHEQAQPSKNGRREDPYYQCERCGRTIRGKSHLMRHQQVCL